MAAVLAYGWLVPKPALACAASGKLVFYTTQLESEAKSLVNAFMRFCPSVHVDWVRAATGRILNFVAVELTAGKPNADVVMLSDALHMLPLKLDNRLMEIADIDVSGLEDGSYDVDRQYFGTRLVTNVIVVAPDADPMPRTWQAFAGAARSDNTAYTSALRSISALNHLFAIVSMPNLGWPHLERLARAGVRVDSSYGRAVADIASGKKTYGVSADYLAVQSKREGAPIEIVFPTDAATAVTHPVAALRATENPKAARAFVAFVLSAASQKMVSNHGFIPVRRDIPMPKDFPERGRIAFRFADENAALRVGAEVRDRYVNLFTQGAPGTGTMADGETIHSGSAQRHTPRSGVFSKKPGSPY